MTLNVSSILCGFAFLFTVSFGWAQPKLTNWNNLEDLLVNDPRPVLVFLHTDWCNYCALMDRKVFRDERVIEILDNKYYYISFNAEQREDIVFGSKTYKFLPKGLKSGVHELAKVLNENEVYPTLLILDASLHPVYKNQAYLKTENMLHILLDSTLY